MATRAKTSRPTPKRWLVTFEIVDDGVGSDGSCDWMTKAEIKNDLTTNISSGLTIKKFVMREVTS